MAKFQLNKLRVKPKFLGMLTVAGLASLSLIAGGQYLWNQNQAKTAQAGVSSISLCPGQIGKFTAKYSNGGDVDGMRNALLKTYVGRGLEVQVNPNTITDKYWSSNTAYPVNPAFVKSSATWGSIIEYRPGTATATSTGTDQPGNIDLPASKTGELVFQAKLSPNILSMAKPGGGNWQIGDTMDPLVENVGIKSFLDFEGRATEAGYARITIIACTSSSSSVSSSSSLSSSSVSSSSVSSSSSSTVSSSSSSAPASSSSSSAPRVLTVGDLGNATCNPDPVTVGNSTTCTFPITNPGTYTLPSEGFTVKIDNSTGTSNQCTIKPSGTSQVLECVQVPTTGSALDLQPVKIGVGSQAPTDKGTVTVISTDPMVVRNGRLYFIAADNAPVNYDPIIRFNTNYSKTQKFKDGPVTLVFDQIKKKNGTNITSGTCTFTLSRYTNAQTSDKILETFQAPISGQTDGGKCQTVLPVAKQNVNYYHVVAKVVDGNEIITDTSILNLYVGGGFVTINPTTTI